ncbi:ferritin-like domain-containing protein, partial [Kitasatospora sp. NPDC047058]|uniref:ferritin-like domain-containing protein n=1 Tax=Kitasatospora sp. NPDC047058 TaxID=3155620 RepID=UPI0033EA76C1
VPPDMRKGPLPGRGQHRAALAAGLPGSAAASAATAPGSAAGTPSGSAPATAGGQAVTTTAALASLERQTAQARLADLGAASPQLARLLASVSAAGVLHAAALGDTAPVTVPAPAPADPAGTPSASAPGTASGTPSGAADGAAVAPEAVTAFQAALSAEHAAIYGYGVVGARLPDDPQRADARTAYAAHQTRRDAWQRLLGGVGATPSAAAAGYQLPFAVTDAAGAGRLAAHIETRLTAVYADLVAAVTGPQRGTAADALRECALRARRWGATATPFPGLPDPVAAATGSPGAAPTG